MILQKVQQIYTTQMLEQILEQHYVSANLSALNDVNNAIQQMDKYLLGIMLAHIDIPTVSGGGSSYGDADVSTYLSGGWDFNLIQMQTLHMI